MTMKAFMSPIGVGWPDHPDDPLNEEIGQDFAAQVEAANIVAVTEPWPMAAIPISRLDAEPKAALAEGVRRFLDPGPRLFSREWLEDRGIVPPGY